MPREPANPRDRWLGWLGTLGDLARVRMLRLLAREELGVGELARALQGRDEEALRLWNLVVSPQEAASNLRVAAGARQKFASADTAGAVVIRR